MFVKVPDTLHALLKEHATESQKGTVISQSNVTCVPVLEFFVLKTEVVPHFTLLAIISNFRYNFYLL